MPQFTSYPHLTPAEFSQTCHHLATRYHSTLPPTHHHHQQQQQHLPNSHRRQWTLRLCTALNTGPFFAPDEPEYTTYLQIVRPLDVEGGDDQGLAVGLQDLEFGGGDEEGDKLMMDLEEGDKETFQVRCLPRGVVYVCQRS